jgi:predicted transcriptional regulator
MARDLMTIRVDRRTRTRLAAASRRRGRTPSAVARAALDAWLDAEDERAGQAPYEAIADLIGCVRGSVAGRRR